MLKRVAAITTFLTMATIAGSSPAAAAPPLTYKVVNADGGVFYRNSARWNDTPRQVGVGVYNGDTVELICGGWGDPVGPNNNRRWHKVRNLSRPVGEGWVADRFLTTPNKANEGTPGERECDGSAPQQASPTPAAQTAPVSRKVAFYSGENLIDGAAGASEARKTGAHRILTVNDTFDGKWPSDRACTPSSNAVNWGNEDIGRLAGWSKGRLGPIYALKHLKTSGQEERAKRINYVILYDPGTPQLLRASCDYKVDSAETLRWWLSLSTDNRLVIMAGNDTATADHLSIRDAYFAKLYKPQNSHLRKQVLVCNYKLDHGPTYKTEAHRRLMTGSRLPTTQGLHTCPRQNGQPVWGWNP